MKSRSDDWQHISEPLARVIETMSIRHITDTKGNMSSKRFIAVEKTETVDTAAIRRQIRLNKDGNHSKLPVHHVTLEKLLDAWEMLNGKPEDLRRTFGE